MRTSLTPEELARVHVEAIAQADADRPFVDPAKAYQSQRLLATRGEEWAESVVLRRFTRRSIALPQYPWLNHGEIEMLILAAQAEEAAVLRNAANPDKSEGGES